MAITAHMEPDSIAYTDNLLCHYMSTPFNFDTISSI